MTDYDKLRKRLEDALDLADFIEEASGFKVEITVEIILKVEGGPKVKA